MKCFSNLRVSITQWLSHAPKTKNFSASLLSTFPGSPFLLLRTPHRFLSSHRFLFMLQCPNSSTVIHHKIFQSHWMTWQLKIVYQRNAYQYANLSALVSIYKSSCDADRLQNITSIFSQLRVDWPRPSVWPRDGNEYAIFPFKKSWKRPT